MHKITLFLLLILPAIVTGQTHKPVKFYINTLEINLDSVFIHPKNIVSYDVKKDSDKQEMIIKTKGDNWRFKRIDDIISNYPFYAKIVLDRSITTIYYINNKLINNKFDAKIDNSFFEEVTFISLSDVKNLDEKCRKIIIVDIKLTDKKPKPKIYIRGDSPDEIAEYLKRDK